MSAKHGVVGLMRTLALELAPHLIRVNSVHPTTGGHRHDPERGAYRLFAPDLPEDERTSAAITSGSLTINTLPVPWIEPVDVSNAVLLLASDEARYVTGVPLPIDAGELLK